MNTAKNISKANWVTPLGVASFQAERAYGVLNAEGQALSSDGVQPCSFHSMKVAKEIAVHADGFADHTWVNLI